jgi:hypothetical protein
MLLNYASSGALALPGHPGIAALPLHYGGRAARAYFNAEHWNENAIGSLPAY